MSSRPNKVTLVTDLDLVVQELVPQPAWMVRPTMNRKYPTQRMTIIAEIVDLNTINLAKMQTFEML